MNKFPFSVQDDIVVPRQRAEGGGGGYWGFLLDILKID